ncbi:hypothetical protein VDGL01_00620 [Verticillium dahliae]
MVEEETSLVEEEETTGDAVEKDWDRDTQEERKIQQRLSGCGQETGPRADQLVAQPARPPCLVARRSPNARTARARASCVRSCGVSPNEDSQRRAFDEMNTDDGLDLAPADQLQHQLPLQTIHPH